MTSTNTSHAPSNSCRLLLYRQIGPISPQYNGCHPALFNDIQPPLPFPVSIFVSFPAAPEISELLQYHPLLSPSFRSPLRQIKRLVLIYPCQAASSPQPTNYSPSIERYSTWDSQVKFTEDRNFNDFSDRILIRSGILVGFCNEVTVSAKYRQLGLAQCCISVGLRKIIKMAGYLSFLFIYPVLFLKLAGNNT